MANCVFVMIQMLRLIYHHLLRVKHFVNKHCLRHAIPRINLSCLRLAESAPFGEDVSLRLH